MKYIIRCTHCNRTDKEIFDCSSREFNRCPFIRLENVNELLLFINQNKSIIYIVSFFAILIVWNTLSLIWIAILIVLVVAFIIARLIQDVKLYNPESGIRVKRISLGTQEIGYLWSIKGESLPISFRSNSGTLPLSIIGLALISRDFETKYQTDLRIPLKNCVTIIRFALISLIINENIEVYRYDNNYSDDRYYFVIGQNTSPVEGNLEREIFRVVQLCKNKLDKGIWSWTDGLTIHNLISSIFSKSTELMSLISIADHVSYKQWLIKNVCLNAEQLGLGNVKNPSFLGLQITQDWIRLEWEKSQMSKIQYEIQIADNLSSQLAMINPDFSQELDKHILIAIESREPKSD